MPQQRRTEQADSKVLRLPDGLETVRDCQFSGSDVDSVIVPVSVTVLGSGAFSICEQLREIVFAHGSRLKTIESNCFVQSGLRKIIIPKNV